MYKINVAKRKEYITPYTKETVENLLKANNIKLEGDVGYDAVYVANMAKADFYGSSISDDMHLLLNADDPFVCKLAQNHKGKVTYFGIGEHENVENNKRAIKIILQEDFEAFKSETLLNFEIN